MKQIKPTETVPGMFLAQKIQVISIIGTNLLIVFIDDRDDQGRNYRRCIGGTLSLWSPQIARPTFYCNILLKAQVNVSLLLNVTTSSIILSLFNYLIYLKNFLKNFKFIFQIYLP